jgi:hypothetical protein
MKSVDSIAALVLKTVKAYPFDVCRQPKSFSLVSSKKATSTANFGMTYSDAQKGYYWGRNFEATGMDVDCVTAEKPAVYLSQTGVSDKKLGGRICLDFELGIVDIVDCDTCGEECRRNDGQLLSDLVLTLRAIKAEILRNLAYDVVYADGTTARIWATDNEIALQITEGVFSATPEKVHHININKFITFQERHEKQELDNNHLSAFLFFTYCGCEDENLVFDYREHAFDRGAVAKCETCI